MDLTNDQDPLAQLDPYEEPKLICRYCKAEHCPLICFCGDCGRQLDLREEDADLAPDVRLNQCALSEDQAVTSLVQLYWLFKPAARGSYRRRYSKDWEYHKAVELHNRCTKKGVCNPLTGEKDR